MFVIKSNCSKLFVLWLILYTITGIIGKVYIEIFRYTYGVLPNYILSDYHKVIILIATIVFIPLLFFTRYTARKEKKKGILIASNILLLHHILCVFVTFIYVFRGF